MPKIAGIFRKPYKLVEYANGWLHAPSRQALTSETQQYAGYFVSYRVSSRTDFNTHKNQFILSVIDIFNKTDLDWFFVQNNENTPQKIIVKADRRILSNLLDSSVLPRETMVHGIKTSGPWTRLGSYLGAASARQRRFGNAILAAPRGIDKAVPDTSAFLLTLYLQDEHKQHLIGPEAGVEINVLSSDEDFQAAYRVHCNSEQPGRSRSDCRYASRVRADIPVCFDTDFVPFPIDIVYTWVDGSDPAWLADYNAACETHGRKHKQVRAAHSPARFASVDELRYSLRSAAEFAPWIRHVWLVTADQTPAWLEESDWITVVTHKEIFPDDSCLPSFNSCAIEACLHHIPGLADHFLYFNDDFFLGRATSADLFFNPDGSSKVLLSPDELESGSAHPNELSPDSTGKNGRDLVERLTGKRFVRKYEHAPHPLQKKTLIELERAAPELVSETQKNKFRAYTDITLAGWLHNSYALALGHAEVTSFRFSYIDFDKPQWRDILRNILNSRDLDAFCLNTVYSAPPAEETAKFLDRYYPEPHPHENMRLSAAN